MRNAENELRNDILDIPQGLNQGWLKIDKHGQNKLSNFNITNLRIIG